jgi:crossover junction endodeoxyribonuclease RuvC
MTLRIVKSNCLFFLALNNEVGLMVEDKIILGIDPGTTVMGYGLIHVQGKKTSMVNFGIIQLNKISNHPDKLKRINDRLNGIITEFKPDELAIEAPFFGKNVQSMLKLGRAQGVAIAAALNHNLPFEEYSPRRIKQAITGSGRASKEQVAAMLQKVLKFEEIPKYLDATDGLAVALCHHYSKGVGEHNKSKSSSWGSFVKNNPDRKLNK